MIGFVIPEGPRGPGDKINLDHKRYLSEYLKLGNLPHIARAVLETGGLKPGDPILLSGDGYPKIWDRYEVTLGTDERIEILDE